MPTSVSGIGHDLQLRSPIQTHTVMVRLVWDPAGSAELVESSPVDSEDLGRTPARDPIRPDISSVAAPVVDDQRQALYLSARQLSLAVPALRRQPAGQDIAADGGARAAKDLSCLIERDRVGRWHSLTVLEKTMEAPGPCGKLARQCLPWRTDCNRMGRTHMAQRSITVLVDDLSGKELEDGTGDTVDFALDGIRYEIDLHRASADKLRAALAPFIRAGRRARTPADRRPPARRVQAPPDPSAVRAWAAAHGIEVSKRGRIPASVVDQFIAAGN